MGKGERTRERIAELSAELFNRQGYNATSLQEIMEATGMEKGGIYNHFRNKEEILMEAFDLCFVRILQRFKEYYDPSGNHREKMLSLFNFYESLWIEPVIRGNYPLIGLGMYASEIGHEFEEKVKQAFKKLEYIISVILQENQHDVINTEFLFSSLNGSLFLSFYFNDSHYLNDTLRTLRQLI
jgi:AcrR family transcriptional regulator